MAKKMTSEELKQQAELLKQQAQDKLKEARRLARKEARQAKALEEKKQREEWLLLRETALSHTVRIDGETMTVFEYIKKLQQADLKQQQAQNNEQQQQQ